MKTEELIQLVQGMNYLNEARKTLIIENAPRMSDHERDLLAKSLQQTKTTIDSNNQQILQELEKIADALKTFKKKELPKMVKAEEKKERKKGEKKAEKLLKKL